MSLSSEEIALIQRSRAVALASRADFMTMANEVCELMEVPFSKICGLTRGDLQTCEARAMICRIAADRGWHPKVIARYIRRDRSSVIKAIASTRPESDKAPE